MNEQVRAKILKARSQLLLNHFFFGRLALYLRMVEDPSIPTLAVDGKHVFYNPDFVSTLTHDLVQSAMVHEILHCVFDHIGRRNGRDPATWNSAADYAINLLVKEAGFRLGEGWLFDPKFAGMSAEHIYEQIKQDSKDGDKDQSDIGKALCDIRNGASEAGNVETRMEWKVAVSHAASAAKKAGKLPASMNRFADDGAVAKVPWREVLRRFITDVSKNDYAWTRPNRRMLANGLYLPGLYSEEMGAVEIVIDTSGSIDQFTLNAFSAEVQAVVASASPAKVRITYCDARINKVDDFERGEPLSFKLVGGGGTDFRPPFDAIAEHGEKPVALIYLTDMHGPFPKEEPEFPVLWCATSDVVAPFGETVRLEL